MVPSVRQLRIVNSVLCGAALLVTIVRLWIRQHRKKLWWDDLWVVFAAICTIVLVVANFYHTADPDSLPRNTKIAVYWLCIHFYYGVTWTSRLSILCTVIRISTGRMRQFLKLSAWLFGLSWVILFAQVFWVCIPEPTWRDDPTPQCRLGDDVAIAQAITFVGTDAILIFAPIQLIWAARLSQGTKIRLISIFAATILTTAASLYYIYAMLRIGAITEEFAATVHDGISLLVANLSVVVSFFFKLTHKEDTSNDHTTPITFYNNRLRTGLSRSFAFLSTTRSEHEMTLPPPAHVHLHIEVERDCQSRKSLAVEDIEAGTGHVQGDFVGNTKIQFDGVKGQETYELKNISRKGSDMKVPRS
ncbi:hypothetical protein BDY19DRAFT_998099 [Irpex rosettiformis]|uniref:Uncharacterized protein n=1 Tax=Irpex rosettiformis TaxID=378272 RepID=A0ACB8TPN9_9APHY|nr:hypothetical protein BDY19DRAFT_998099 [Irpex rosettiformis]